MKNIAKFAVLTLSAGLLYLIDIPQQPLQLPLKIHLVPEAEAILGVRRRTARRAVAVGYAAGASSAQASQASSAEATQPATNQTVAAPAPAPAPASAPPVGTTVTSLPDGCTTTSQSGVQYNNCGGVYYRTAFQGNTLVYVVSQP